MKPKLRIYRDAAGEFRWRLTVGKEVVADGSEGYSTKSNAARAAKRLRAIMTGAGLVVQ